MPGGTSKVCPKTYARFPTTRWSIVYLAQDEDDEVRRQALATLFELYWYPMYAFARNRGFNAEDSRDLIQHFFQRIIENSVLEGVHQERGRFRAFVRTALSRHLKDHRVKESAQKRGGGAWTFCSLDEAEERYARRLGVGETPESSYEREWAHAVLERALAALAAEHARSDKGASFQRLRPFLPGAYSREPYQTVADALGITEAALKVRIHRLRQRFAAYVREEVAQTLADEQDLDSEIQHLLRALCDPGAGLDSS